MAYNDYIPEKNIWADKVVKWISDISTVVVLALFLCIYLGDRVEISGSSMSPVLENSEKVLVDKISYTLKNPKRFDIIVYKSKSDNNQYYIKRIIGLPGESVTITDSKIYITASDGEKWELKDPYCTVDKYESGYAENTVYVGGNEYFVLGDNRNLSEDSRFSYVGNISKDDIIGKAWFIVSPIKKLGFVSK